jgi:hypothetical protein
MQTRTFELDVDANAGDDALIDTPVENIVTRLKESPKGRVRISVDYFETRSGGEPRSFSVFVVVDGKCQTFRGTVHPYEMKHVCEIDRARPFLSDEDVAAKKWLQLKAAWRQRERGTAREILTDLMTNYSSTEAAGEAKAWAIANGERLESE